MAHVLRGLALGWVWFVAIVAAADDQSGLRITDVARTATLVYPNGPRVTVANPQAVANVEVWVMRELDGAIVRKYRVSTEPRWKQTIKLDTAGPDTALAELVNGGKTYLRFRLFLIKPNREVQEHLLVKVRRSAPASDFTSPLSSSKDPMKLYAYGGKLEAIEGDEVFVRPWADCCSFEKPNLFKASSNPKTEVSAVGEEATVWKWTDVKANLKVGDQVSILYSEKGGRNVVKELVVATPPAPPSTGLTFDPFAGLHFQIGTVVSANEDRVTPNKPGDMIVETQGASGKWRIRDNTRIMRGAAEGQRSDLSPKALIAVGASRLPDGEVSVVHILVLKDLTESTSP